MPKIGLNKKRKNTLVDAIQDKGLDKVKGHLESQGVKSKGNALIQSPSTMTNDTNPTGRLSSGQGYNLTAQGKRMREMNLKDDGMTQDNIETNKLVGAGVLPEEQREIYPQSPLITPVSKIEPKKLDTPEPQVTGDVLKGEELTGEYKTLYDSMTPIEQKQFEIIGENARKKVSVVLWLHRIQ